MPATTHIARVVATFEFVGILPIGEYADPEKAVRERFKFFNCEMQGFAEQTRSLAIRTEKIPLPDLPSLVSPTDNHNQHGSQQRPLSLQPLVREAGTRTQTPPREGKE